MKNKTFLILGGDSRSLYLGEYLEKQGLKICYFAFNNTDCFDSLKEAFAEADCIILPLPLTRDRVTLNTPLFDGKILLNDIYPLLSADKFIFGGQLTGSFTEELDARAVPYCDYFLLDELSVYNAVPTAEGVAEILLKELPITVHGSRLAVLGYGRVGKVLAQTLQNMGANVTVFARKQRDFADAFTKGMQALDFSRLNADTFRFDAVINTVPALVLGENELKNINSDCLLIETASTPFGIDFQVAKEKAFDVIKAGSLPGKVAPKTAGEIIGRSIFPIIQTRGLISCKQ